VIDYGNSESAPRTHSFAEWRSEFVRRGTMPPMPKMDNFGISAETVRNRIDRIKMQRKSARQKPRGGDWAR